MTMTSTFVVTGQDKIHCASCEARIGNALNRIAGVRAVSASQKTQSIKVEFDPDQTSKTVIRTRLEDLGYEIRPKVS